jgi:hypothetical protein
MRLTGVEAPRTYTLVFEGQGGVAGFGKGSAQVTLEPEGEAATRLSYTVHAQVGGKLAQIGSRLVDGAARKIAREFFKRFGQQLGGEVKPHTDDDGAPPEVADTPSPAPADAAQDESADDGQAKRKRSWTAWISKS